jgi:hypothetical protein
VHDRAERAFAAALEAVHGALGEVAWLTEALKTARGATRASGLDSLLADAERPAGDRRG